MYKPLLIIQCTCHLFFCLFVLRIQATVNQISLMVSVTGKWTNLTTILILVKPIKVLLTFSQLRASEEDKSLQEARESALEQKVEDNNEKILKLERYWLEAQDLCKGLNEQLVETQAQYETLDKKYNKAKKLLKDYQQK